MTAAAAYTLDHRGEDMNVSSKGRLSISGGSLINFRVLLIDDQEEVATAMQRALHREGMQTIRVNTGADALKAVRTFNPSIVLIDLDLPDTNGIPLIQWLVSNTASGVIVVTCSADEADRVISLESGADDFISKPAPPRELVARIRAVHRRLQAGALSKTITVAPPSVTKRHPIAVGRLTVDLERRRAATIDGQDAHLTTAEFDALATLIEAGGLPVSRSELSQKALRRRWFAESRGVDQLILGLRRQVACNLREGKLMLQTIRGAGYQLCLPSQ